MPGPRGGLVRHGGYGDEDGAATFDQIGAQRGAPFDWYAYREGQSLKDLQNVVNMMQSGMLSPEEAFPEGSSNAALFKRHVGVDVPAMQEVITPDQMTPEGELIPGKSEKIPGLGLGRQSMLSQRILRQLQLKHPVDESMVALSGLPKTAEAKELLMPETTKKLFKQRFNSKASKEYAQLYAANRKLYGEASPDAVARMTMAAMAGTYPDLYGDVQAPTTEEIGRTTLEVNEALKRFQIAENNATKTNNLKALMEARKAAQDADRALRAVRITAQNQHEAEGLELKKMEVKIKEKVAGAQIVSKIMNAFDDDFGEDFAFKMAQYYLENGTILGSSLPPEVARRAQAKLERADQIEQMKIDNHASMIRTREGNLSSRQVRDLADVEYKLANLKRLSEKGDNGSKELFQHVNSLIRVAAEERKANKMDAFNTTVTEIYELLGAKTTDPGLWQYLPFVGGNSAKKVEFSAGPRATSPSPSGPPPAGGNLKALEDLVKDLRGRMDAIGGGQPAPAPAPQPGIRPPARAPQPLPPRPGPMLPQPRPMTTTEEYEAAYRRRRGLPPLERQ